MLRNWNNLPYYMQNDMVRPYYDSLKKKQFSLCIKRSFDFILSLLMLFILLPLFIILSILIVIDSKGGVFFCQERITQYGKKFKIFKFRTMIADAENKGNLITVNNDTRITKIGYKLRKYRLDEIPQLINILLGDMSFVGTRPEVTKYVKQYTPEMMATLLLPAGVTSECSIKYKNETILFDSNDSIENIYIKKILPAKMKYNLESIKNFSFISEIITIFRTVFVIVRK